MVRQQILKFKNHPFFKEWGYRFGGFCSRPPQHAKKE
jgi:hypothetical protein